MLGANCPIFLVCCFLTSGLKTSREMSRHLSSLEDWVNKSGPHNFSTLNNVRGTHTSWPKFVQALAPMFLNTDTTTTNFLGGRNITELFPIVTLFQVYKNPIGCPKSNPKMLKICRTKGILYRRGSWCRSKGDHKLYWDGNWVMGK